MKISVITVCYNAVSCIEDTILSVINQTYKELEYIIIDGRSNDGTTEIIKKYSTKITYWISEPDKGIYDAMNKGLHKATGDWINFMNAGDTFAENCTIEQVFSQNNYENIYALYGNAIYLQQYKTELRKAKSVKSIKYNMPITHQAFFVRSNIAKKIKFNTKYKYAADYNMIYNILKVYGPNKIKQINITITNYEAFAGLTMQNKNEVFGEVIKIRDLDLKWFWDFIKYYIKKIVLHNKK
mgnify:CR=1 FL=1